MRGACGSLVGCALEIPLSAVHGTHLQRVARLTRVGLAPGEGGGQPSVVSAHDQMQAVRVLVVDDSEVFRNVMAAVVAATPGFEVVGRASSGREALHLVDELAPQLCLLDLRMPDIDGIETALRLRRHHPDVVVLLLTASQQACLSDPSLAIEHKSELSAEWLIEFWRRNVDPDFSAARRA